MADGVDSCDVVDSWEDIDENNMFERTLPVNKPKSSAILTKGPLVVQGDESLRTHYIPMEHSVRILKRPSRDEKLTLSGDSSVNGVGKPVKTLRQREAEYAEARLRILGSASSPEFDANERLAINDGAAPPTPAAVYMLLRPPPPPPQDNSRCPPDIIRHPRGPDGSPGFTLRR